jgi:dienelactone hydrolase
MTRAARRAGIAAATVLVVLVGYLAVVGVLRSQPVALPEPAGPHPVGRVVTTVPAGDFAGEPDRAAWVWYPAAASDAPRAEYVPDGWYGTLPPVVGAGWLMQDVHAVQPHAVPGAPPAPGRLPVVLMLPGFESAPWMYTSIGEALASHGYVVALLVPPTTPARVVAGERRTSPEAAGQPSAAEIDELASRQAADLGALLTALPGTGAGAVDVSRAVFAGHSLGGTAAVAACAVDARCVGAIDLDGPLPAAPGPKPVLLLGADGSCAVVDPCVADGLPAGYADWLRERRAGATPRWRATITGAGHNGFGDGAHYFVAPPLHGATGTGSIAPGRMAAVQAAMLTAAADHMLHGASDTLLRAGSPELPELVVGTSPR